MAVITTINTAMNATIHMNIINISTVIGSADSGVSNQGMKTSYDNAKWYVDYYDREEKDCRSAMSSMESYLASYKGTLRSQCRDFEGGALLGGGGGEILKSFGFNYETIGVEVCWDGEERWGCK